MGFFSRVDKAARNILETKASDEMMEKYVGEHPYVFKNKFYNAVWSASQEFQERLVSAGGESLSTEERAMYRLGILSALAHNLQDSARRVRYFEAARQVQRDHEEKIRLDVWIEFDRCVSGLNPVFNEWLTALTGP